MTLELLAPFLVGLFGSLHCLGMCGSLILAYSLHLQSPAVRTAGAGRPLWLRGLLHHLAYHTGRLLTYGILGALAAGLVNVSGFNLYLPVRGGVILAGGILITLLGAAFLGAVPLPAAAGRFSPAPPLLWDRFLPPLLLRPGPLAKAGLGLASGLLPCCLSCSMLIKAAVTENMAAGCLTMVAFGLGTVPALLGLGLSASFFTLRTRRIGEGLAALAIIVLGLILIFRGAKLLV